MPSERFRMLRPYSRTARVCRAGSGLAISPPQSGHARPADRSTESQVASLRSGASCLQPLARRDNHPFGPGLVRILAVAGTYAPVILELHPPCSCSDQFANKIAEPNMNSIVFAVSIILAATAQIRGERRPACQKKSFAEAIRAVTPPDLRLHAANQRACTQLETIDRSP